MRTNPIFNRSQGFTLLEILVALFVFTIIAMIMVSTLHTVLTTQSVTEKNTTRFNQIQMALIIISRDFEQTLDRPITNSSGTTEPAVIGERSAITLTHAGMTNPAGEQARSTLQRVHYFYRDHTLIRASWSELDTTQDTPTYERKLLDNITELSFEYLDQQRNFHGSWPITKSNNDNLPKAVRITIKLKNMGKITQLYLIPNTLIN